MGLNKILLFLFFSISLSAEVCFFIPPKGWELADPQALKPRVHVSFLGPSNRGLPPSINLATEPVDVSLDAYMEEVRKIHKSDPNSRWRDLGKFKALLGDGRICELETQTELGVARLIQLVVIKDRIAYILTACALKEEFSQYYITFNEALHSLQASSDLIESYPLSSSQLKELLENLKKKFIAAKFDFSSESFQHETWKPLEKKIIHDFTKMGPYWQILVLKEMQTTLLTLKDTL